MKVKEIKEIFQRMNDDDDFEFRLFCGIDCSKERWLPLEIKLRGSQMTEPLTHYIEFQIPKDKGVVSEMTTFPNVFYFNDHLTTITRVEYSNGLVAYEEESIDGIYKNAGCFYK